MPGKRSEIQFIHSSCPGLSRVASPETQRRVHSHAARAAHAKERRQRLIKYQATKSGSGLEDGRQLFAQAAAEVDLAVIIPRPVDLLGSGRRDPFASFARPLTPMEDFLLDYYVQDVVPCSKIRRDKTNHSGGDIQHINKQFVQLAATHNSTLNGLCLVASRHLSLYLPYMGPYFAQLALRLKIACARSLRETISSLGIRSMISEWTFVLALFLAQDEVLIGDAASTQTHLQGAVQMMRHNDALKKTDCTAFPYDIISEGQGNRLMQPAN